MNTDSVLVAFVECIRILQGTTLRVILRSYFQELLANVGRDTTVGHLEGTTVSVGLFTRCNLVRLGLLTVVMANTYTHTQRGSLSS